MNRTVENNGLIYAEHFSMADVPDDNKTVWFGKESEPLQASLMHYNKGKVFRNHRHMMNPRIIKKTQECFVVIRGSLQIDIYDDVPNDGAKVVNDVFGNRKFHIGYLTARQGDIILVWRGFHRLSILEDYTLAYEIKAGQFTSTYEDKEFFDVVDGE